jgi:hypothetical protein
MYIKDYDDYIFLSRHFETRKAMATIIRMVIEDTLRREQENEKKRNKDDNKFRENNQFTNPQKHNQEIYQN